MYKYHKETQFEDILNAMFNPVIVRHTFLTFLSVQMVFLLWANAHRTVISTS